MEPQTPMDHCVSLRGQADDQAAFVERQLRAKNRSIWRNNCSGIARAEHDGTRAETRFRLSPKRTSPFKTVRASVQSTAGSRGVRISLSNAG